MSSVSDSGTMSMVTGQRAEELAVGLDVDRLGRVCCGGAFDPRAVYESMGAAYLWRPNQTAAMKRR